MPAVGQAHAVAALEVEGLGHHADGENAPLSGALGDDRSGAGAGAAAHARGDEHHVDAVEMLADLRRGFLGRRHADLWVGSGTQALRDVDAQLDALVGLGEGELLRIGVGDDELDTLEPGLDHVVDGVAAGAADAEHDDPRLKFLGLRGEHLERHGIFESSATLVATGNVHLGSPASEPSRAR